MFRKALENEAFDFSAICRLMVQKAQNERKGKESRTYEGVSPFDVSIKLLACFGRENLSLSRDRCFRLPSRPEPGEQIPLNSLESFCQTFDLDFELFGDENTLTNLRHALKWGMLYTDAVSCERAELLVYLSHKCTPRVERWFSRLAEAIVNRRLNTLCEIDGFLQILRNIENDVFTVDSIFTSAQIPKIEINNFSLLNKMHKRVFSTMYRKTRAMFRKKEGVTNLALPTEMVIHLYNIATRYYRSGLRPYVPLLCDLLSDGLFTSNIEIAGAIVYISTSKIVTSEALKRWCGFSTVKESSSSSTS